MRVIDSCENVKIAKKKLETGMLNLSSYINNSKTVEK